MVDVKLSAAADATVRNSNANYNTCRTSATGDTTSTVSVYIGQTTGYYIWRIVAYWDLSAYSGITATSASLNLTGFANEGGSFYIDAFEWDEETAVTVDDYDAFGGTLFGESDGNTYCSVAECINIPLNANGLTNLNSCMGSNYPIFFRSKEDVDASVPAGAEYWRIYGTSLADPSKHPKLNFSYTPSAGSSSPAIPQIIIMCKDLLSPRNPFLDWLRNPFTETFK